MRLVLVPGFSQPASVWSGVLAGLAPSIPSTALEVPDGLNFGATAAAIGARGGAAVYVGYSMGGRLVLQLALDHPALVAGLVLISASPGIADPAARAARAAADTLLASEVDRDGVGPFLERWIAQPLFAGLSRGTAGLEDRVAGTSVTRLMHQLTVLGQGAMPSAWHRLGELSMPVALVTGALDAKYGEIATAMRERNPRFAHRVLGGGHAVPLEQPGALSECLESFLHDLPPGVGPAAESVAE